ncbi:putative low-complexity protein [Thermoplasmatales archaeon BRNA1]|nr:putative low-complexity protein [Thermoplasmatales archaeon BRNA1]
MRRDVFIAYWFILAIIILLAVTGINELTDGRITDWENSTLDDIMGNIMVFLGSTIIAVGGVTITGFIFFIESIRRLVDTNPVYADTVDDMRRRLLYAVIVSFAICIIYAIVCGLCMVTVFDDVGGNHARSVTAAALISVYIILLIENIILDYRVMGYKSYIIKFAQSNRRRIKVRFEKVGTRYIRLRDGEISSIPDELFLEKDGKRRGGLTVKCVVDGDRKYMVDLAENGSIRTIRRMVTKNSASKDSDDGPVNGRTCVINDRYDIRDVMKFYDDTERILKRIAGLSTNSFTNDDYKKLEAALGARTPGTSANGMADDIVDGYHALKKYHDSLIVGDDPYDDKEFIEHSDLQLMLPYLSILRFELVRKLSGKDLSGVNLRGYDFSGAVMRNTILADGAYIDVSFSKSVMDCADASRCDLSMADFRYSSSKSAVFDGSKMVRVNLSHASMEGSSFANATFRHATMSETRLEGCVMKNAEVLSSVIEDSDFSGADFRVSNCSDVTATNVRFANSIFDHSRLADGTYRGCDFTGTNFGSSAVNNMYIEDTILNASRFDNAEIMECIFVNCSFYDSYCSSINFTGSVLMGTDFSEARLSDCDFNKTVICGYRVGNGGKHPSFRHATMTNNTYTDSKIEDAEFTYATLAGSRFSNTRLVNCDFTDCDLTGTSFPDCVFIGAKGLPKGFKESHKEARFRARR